MGLSMISIYILIRPFSQYYKELYIVMQELFKL